MLMLIKGIFTFSFAALEEVCEIPFQLFPHRGSGQAADEIHTVRRYFFIYFHFKQLMRYTQ